MTDTIVYDDPAALEWASKRIFGIEFRPDAHSIGRKVAGRFVGVVVFDTWTDTGCMVHVASNGSRRWVTRRFVMEVFAYPFMTANRKRISALVSVHNAASLAFCRAFGWVEEGRMREAGPDGETMVLFGMLQRECRFLRRQTWPRYIERRSQTKRPVSPETRPTSFKAEPVITLEPIRDDERDFAGELIFADDDLAPLDDDDDEIETDTGDDARLEV